MNNDKIKILEEEVSCAKSHLRWISQCIKEEPKHKGYKTLKKSAEITLEALQKQLAIEKGDGWLPIESAPKDGTELLAYSEKNGCYVTAWIEWIDIDGLCVEGFEFQGIIGSFTHWRPIPQPPKERGEVE